MSCYRESNGVYFTRGDHHPDCVDPTCRGCRVCPDGHCTAKKSCAQHVNVGESTCARCLGRARRTLKRIVTLAPFADALVSTSGDVNSELVNLAGPAADPNTWAIRRRNAQSRLFSAWRAGDITERQLDKAYEAIDDDDDLHPVNLLARWEMMLREDYGQPATAAANLSASATYLDSVLGRVAQDPDQDFPYLAKQLRDCKDHLELAESLSLRKRRGAPCPLCIVNLPAGSDEKAPNLQLERGHWCEDPTCERLHWPEDPDVWRCPRNRDHAWSDEDYRRRVDDVYATQVADA